MEKAAPTKLKNVLVDCIVSSTTKKCSLDLKLGFTSRARICNIKIANKRTVPPCTQKKGDLPTNSQNYCDHDKRVAVTPLSRVRSVRTCHGHFYGRLNMKNSNTTTATKKTNLPNNPTENELPATTSGGPLTAKKTRKPQAAAKQNNNATHIQQYEHLKKYSSRLHYALLEVDGAITLRDSGKHYWEYALSAVRTIRVFLVDYISNLETRLKAKGLPVHPRAWLANEVVKATDLVLIAERVVDLGLFDEVISTSLMYPLLSPGHELLLNFYLENIRKTRRAAAAVGLMDDFNKIQIYVPSETPSGRQSKEV